ncbi:MAG: type IV toxin-antitoxin system AbiEi family antitoxin [Elusimicrobia bacterium]|nr:type IV toxin-antitoxin system AbiEi family antitoxin [Elusimicrobiota bacterium]
MKHNSKSRGKLSKLLASWPTGMVAVHPWLRKHGVSGLLANYYHRAGWVHRIGRGAYARLDDKVDWTGGLHAVQYQMGLPVHVGGKRSLELQGYAHFLRMREVGTVRLYAPRGTRLPAWLRRHDWGVKFVYTAANLFSGKLETGLTEKAFGDFPIRLSAPERAILELLQDVPGSQSFEEARLLMGSLATLRPNLLQTLLESCRSVKAKRLFLFLAEEAGHAWVKQLNLKRVQLGKGKRSVVKGGRFDSKYQITVEPPSEPKSLGDIP